jgi:integrase
VAESIGPPVTYRALRHTHLSHLMGGGIDAVKIGERLGHSSSIMTPETYAHRFRKRDDKAAPLPIASFFSTEPGGNLVAVFALY